jgi:hypothetical protein
MYVICRGTVSCQVSGKEVRQITSCNSFGDMALFSRQVFSLLHEHEEILGYAGPRPGPGLNLESAATRLASIAFAISRIPASSMSSHLVSSYRGGLVRRGRGPDPRKLSRAVLHTPENPMIGGLH